MATRMGWLAGLSMVLALGACSESGDRPSRLVVTADWLNKSLTLFDYEVLTDAQSTARDAIVRTIDLSAFEPGPLELELMPDGRSALVAVSPGFFDGEGTTNALVGSPEVAPGGTLLIVDLESGGAVEVDTAHVPMGIAIAEDGSLAYTANYGTLDEPGNTLSVIDIARAEVVQELRFSGRPEQVALSPDGRLGAVNVAGANGGVHIFETADPSGTLSPLLPTGNDPSDLTFLDDSSRVVVANSFGFDLSLVDTSDPSTPILLGNFPIGGGFPYGVTYLPSRQQVLAPAGTGMNLVTVEVDGDRLVPAEPDSIPGGAFPLTAAVDGTDSFAFVAHIADRSLSVIDLESGAVRALTWLDGPGPSYTAVQP